VLAEKDDGAGTGNIDGGAVTGKLCSTVPAPICMQNLHTKSSVPYENSMGFYREGTKSAYLCVMVWAWETAVC